jgi:hypothetical protein
MESTLPNPAAVQATPARQREQQLQESQTV